MTVTFRRQTHLKTKQQKERKEKRKGKEEQKRKKRKRKEREREGRERRESQVSGGDRSEWRLILLLLLSNNLNVHRIYLPKTSL